jgi:hypothetical protein
LYVQYVYLCVPYLNFEIDNRFLQNLLRYWRIFRCRYCLRSANRNQMTKEPSCDVAAMSGSLTLGSCTNVWSQNLRKYGIFVKAHYCGKKLLRRVGEFARNLLLLPYFRLFTPCIICVLLDLKIWKYYHCFTAITNYWSCVEFNVRTGFRHSYKMCMES